MCRVLTYLGNPILIEELLYLSDSSFIKQSYNPKHMSHLLNLAGFGMIAWDEHPQNPSLPFIYKTDQLPFYDENLRNLSSKISPYCLLTHLRGVPFSGKHVISNQNVHPFLFPGTDIALAHNGALLEFSTIKYDLLEHIKPEYQKYIRGTTDSEWIYAIFLSQLTDPSKKPTTQSIITAIINTFKMIQKVRLKNNIKINSPVNLFISNGEFIAATRFVFDYGWQPLSEEDIAHFGYHSLWYTCGERFGLHDNAYKMKIGGKKSSIIIASEPLTEDTTTWTEVPEYTVIVARKEGDEINVVTQRIDI